jgi:hypothetical protein
MPLSAIVLVVLRLFCVCWLVDGLTGLAVGFAYYNPQVSIIPQLLEPLTIVLFAVVGWIIAPTLSRLVIGQRDAVIQSSELTLGDLYAFAFVFLGLYFVLSSVADTLNWFHYFLWINAGNRLLPSENAPSYYSLSRALISMIAGLICLFRGRRWARKLAASDQPPAPNPG